MVDDATVPISLVAYKIAFDGRVVSQKKLPITMSLVANPISFIGMLLDIAFSVFYLTKPFFLAANEFPRVLSPILPGSSALASHFSVLEITFVSTAVFHQ